MIRKSLIVFGAALLLMTLDFQAFGSASRSKAEPTLLVVPARYSVVQVASDIAQQYPVVLVTYQGQADTRDPLLHAWNGKQWVFVSMADFSSGRFIRNKPTRAILVGDERTLPDVLVPAASWARKVMNVPSIGTADLVNTFGREFNFGDYDWQWYARRYNLDLEDLNSSEISSWYDGRYDRHRKVYYPPGSSVEVYRESDVSESSGSGTRVRESSASDRYQESVVVRDISSVEVEPVSYPSVVESSATRITTTSSGREPKEDTITSNRRAYMEKGAVESETISSSGSSSASTYTERVTPREGVSGKRISEVRILGSREEADPSGVSTSTSTRHRTETTVKRSVAVDPVETTTHTRRETVIIRTDDDNLEAPDFQAEEASYVK